MNIFGNRFYAQCIRVPVLSKVPHSNAQFLILFFPKPNSHPLILTLTLTLIKIFTSYIPQTNPFAIPNLPPSLPLARLSCSPLTLHYHFPSCASFSSLHHRFPSSPPPLLSSPPPAIPPGWVELRYQIYSTYLPETLLHLPTYLNTQVE